MLNLLERQKKKNNVIKAYQRMFETEDGKIVIKDLMKSCHINSSTFNGDTHESAFNEGQRAVMLRIFSILKTEPELILEQLLKHEERADED